MKSTQFVRIGGLATILFVVASMPAAAQSAEAVLKNADGKDVGTVRLIETVHGVLLSLKVNGLPPGEHAFHVHEVGKCEPPFTSAGGHFNPGHKKHGLLAPEGYHAGDMPNLHIPASGQLELDVMNTAITLQKDKPNSVIGGDGSTVIIHTGKDDYKTDPTGDAGGRIACGVIQTN